MSGLPKRFRPPPPRRPLFLLGWGVPRGSFRKIFAPLEQFHVSYILCPSALVGTMGSGAARLGRRTRGPSPHRVAAPIFNLRSETQRTGVPMPKPPARLIDLPEALRIVCEVFECSCGEAEKYLYEEVRYGSVPLIGPGGGPVAVHDDTFIDFEKSSTSRTRRLQTRAITDDCPDGEWEDRFTRDTVRVDRNDLEELIQSAPSESCGAISTPASALRGTVRAETQCKLWLRELSRPGKPIQPKDQCWAEAEQRFQALSRRGFNRCWDAIMPGDWKKPGPRPESKQ